MVELSFTRISQIMHEETPQTEMLPTILRGIYTRYMHLYETYYADIDALNDSKIAELKKYHEETRSLVKYYYLDIPHDICLAISEFDKKHCDRMLRPGWRRFLTNSFQDYRDENDDLGKNEKAMKADFSKEVLESFYDSMDYIFRDGFGTNSDTAQKFSDGLERLFSSD